MRKISSFKQGGYNLSLKQKISNFVLSVGDTGQKIKRDNFLPVF